jgi:type IV pilus assembly protein PilY1
VNQRNLARGANLLNYLRGQRGNEGFDSGPPATSNETNKLYRTREHVLGDIISAQPVFVKAPFAEYSAATDPGYIEFRTAQAGRIPMVYVAANDGMLHAFKAGTSILDTQGGVEAWAFIPSMVLPNLYKLASENYGNQHVYSVDGTPTAADVFDTTVAGCAVATPTNPQNCWKTILVAGLNKGGKGYYALDISDPANPKGLWEFKYTSTCAANPVGATSDCHLGYSYSNPIIGKLANGRWVVFLTSGYNNDDGIGYLYVLDAISGQIIYRISTVTGSGLNHINGWADNAAYDNTIKRIYGGDLLGNIWRFDVNDSIPPSGREAGLIAQVVDPGGNPQSITTKPELAEIAGDPYVYVGTGRYLGTTDLANTQTQTIWAIKDPMSSTIVTNLRTTLGERVIVNVGSGTSATRKIADLPTGVSCEAGEGWFADLPDEGERVNIDIKLQLGTLIVPSNVPKNDACTVGGYSWLNYFNYATGCAVSNALGKVGQRMVGSSGTESLAVGINIVRLPNGKTVVIATTSGAEQITFDAPFDTPPPVGKRVSWREIVR